MVEIVGYGTGFRPVAPFMFGRLAGAREADTVVFARLATDSVTNLLVVPGGRSPAGPLRLHGAEQGGLTTYHDGGPDSPQVLLGVGVADVADVAQPVDASPERAWSLRTEDYRIPWPEGTNVRSRQPGGPWPFELYPIDGVDNCMIMFRGPLSRDAVPSPAELIAPGQHLVDSGVTDTTIWTELVYEVGGRRWWQRHEWIALGETVVLATAQAPEDDVESLRRKLVAVASGLHPRRPDDDVAFALTR